MGTATKIAVVGSEPRSGRRGGRLVHWLIVLQLVMIVVAGVLVVARLPIWSYADERAHAAYVDAMGSGHLPVLGKDPLPSEIAKLGPRPTGFAAMSYEAFQPPLYYLVAGPGWDAASAIGGTRAAVRAVRALDLAALGVTLFLLWALARRMGRGRDEALLVFAVALTFVAWPGVIFRSVTISNTALDMPLAAGVLLALWIAWNRRDPRALAVAAVGSGLGLLCQLPFPPVLLVPVVAWRFRTSAPKVAIAAVLLPAILLLPWVVDNLHRYGALTASSIMREMQGGFLNPGDRPYDLGRLAHADVLFLNGVLPEDWSSSVFYFKTTLLPLAVLHALRGALVAVMGGFGVVWAIRRPRGSWLLVAPILIGLLLTQVQTIVVRLPLTQPRYLYPVLPAFGLAGGLALTRLVGPRYTFLVTTLLTVALAGLWIYLSGVPTLRG